MSSKRTFLEFYQKKDVGNHNLFVCELNRNTTRYAIGFASTYSSPGNDNLSQIFCCAKNDKEKKNEKNIMVKNMLKTRKMLEIRVWKWCEMSHQHEKLSWSEKQFSFYRHPVTRVNLWKMSLWNRQLMMCSLNVVGKTYIMRAETTLEFTWNLHFWLFTRVLGKARRLKLILHGYLLPQFFDLLASWNSESKTRRMKN